MKTKFQNEKFLNKISFDKGDINIAIAYPNRYWVAMSNLGFQAVYKLFASQQRFKAERCYLPDDEGAEIKSFETSKTLSSFDVLAISVSFETDYPNVLSIIKSAGVNLCQFANGSKSDTTYRPFILGGGAALTLNPEPLANFFDAIVIGEGEEVISEISETYINAKNNNLDYSQLLEELSKIHGVYIPSFYKVNYNSDYTIQKFSSDYPRTVRRYLKDVNAYSSDTVIQTPDTEFKSMFMTETGRGCEIGCKFCVAGYMYRPVRKRSKETLMKSVKFGLENSDSIGFVGASVSSHKNISELASHVAKNGKRAALSSIMTQKVTPELSASLSESEYKTVALAPEAGTNELRFKVGKRVTNDQFVNGIRTLARNGIRNFKLYFIVGLPTEMEKDIIGIVNLVKESRDAAIDEAVNIQKRKIAPKIILSVNPFIPKAWTPFQRHAFLDSGLLKKKLKTIRSNVQKLPNVVMKAESPRESYFQTLLSRGDRRVGKLLVEMIKQNKDWKWITTNSNKQILGDVPPADFYTLRQINENEILPWEIVDLKIKRSLLEREYKRTFSEDVTPLIEKAIEGETFFKKKKFPPQTPPSKKLC